MDRQKRSAPQPRSHLFTVRLWREEMGGGANEVRMQVRHVLSGEMRYFRDWSALVDYLQEVWRQIDQSP
jgi:hypothetical protein